MARMIFVASSVVVHCRKTSPGLRVALPCRGWHGSLFVCPIPSMYGISTYIWLIFMVNVGKYTIHGLFVCVWDGNFATLTL